MICSLTASPGEPYDPNSGFYYNRARWLDVAVGRFISTDPFPGLATEPATLHRYLYTENQPTLLVDPSGRLGLGATIAIGVDIGILAGALLYSFVTATSTDSGKLGTCTDGRQPTRWEVNKMGRSFPRLGKDFRVTGPATGTYNCIAWTVGDTTDNLWLDVSMEYGDGDPYVDLLDFHKMYTDRGMTEVPTAADANVIVYATPGPREPQHAAISHVCASGEKVFESKLGEWERILHRPQALTDSLYGIPVRFYR